MKKLDFGKRLMTVFVAIYAVVSLYPIIWLLIQSLKTDMEFYKNQYAISLKPQFINYSNAWQKANFSQYYKNSIIVTVLSIVLVVLICTLAAYAFSKMNFIGKKVLNLLLVIVMFLPATMLVFPVFTVVMNLGIKNTYAALIGPYVCGAVPISVLIFTQAFSDIPKELNEAARIDGCWEYRIWYTIMMPLIKPSIATVTVLTFMSVWNEYFWALVSLSDKKLYTLPIGIADIGSKISIYGYSTVFAGMVMTTAPVLILYIILQKQFVKAVTSGAVKG